MATSGRCQAVHICAVVEDVGQANDKATSTVTSKALSTILSSVPVSILGSFLTHTAQSLC